MRPHALLTKGKIGVERKYLTRAGSAVERKKERKKANAHDEERERERIKRRKFTPLSGVFPETSGRP